ncbi:MAG: ChaN family lipoprotein [Desulfuromonadales bacterium]
MKLCQTVLVLVAFFVGSLLLSMPASAHIMAVDGNRIVTFDQLIDDLGTARIVFVGELHDRPGHHRAQLQVIQGLQATGRPVAIGLEMARQEAQEALDQWVGGRMGEQKFRRIFEEGWGMWEQYQEILQYARKNRIPLVALNVSRDITQQVAQEGFDSLSAEQSQALPGVTCTIDPEYRDFIRRTLGNHAHDGAQFENFCEAQMVWDTVMARNIVHYLGDHPETTMVVLAGSGHAWKYGIPEQVRRQGGEFPSRVLLPEIVGRIAAGEITTDEADYLLLGVDEAELH